MLRVSTVAELTPAPYTVLGWKVPEIRAIVQDLASEGITLERYKALPQDELGIWTSLDGHRVAWFKDPDGNTPSLTQFSEWPDEREY